jgi:hypothetical protein
MANHRGRGARGRGGRWQGAHEGGGRRRGRSRIWRPCPGGGALMEVEARGTVANGFGGHGAAAGQLVEVEAMAGRALEEVAAGSGALPKVCQ